MNEFIEKIPEEEEIEIKRPSRSGRSSRTNKGAAVRAQSAHHDLTPDYEEAGVDEDFEYTPDNTGYSAHSKKTRLGSTDRQGNRLSNLPGERPSLTSVTPYDDYANELVDKVE